MYTKRTFVAATMLLCVIVSIATAQCTVANLTVPSAFEKNSIVIDVRPDEINQFKGKSSFKNEARIVLVNMNPFLFSYSLKVDQTEVKDTGFLNFLKLLGSPVGDLVDSVSAFNRGEALNVAPVGNIALLIQRTSAPPAAPHSSCNAAQTADAMLAIQELTSVRKAVLDKLIGVGGQTGLRTRISNDAAAYGTARTSFKAQKDIIFNSSVEATPLCTAANTLHSELSGANYPNLATLRTDLAELEEFQSLVEELKNIGTEYETEYAGCPARANGLSYAANLVRLANALSGLAADYETKLTAFVNETKSYDALVTSIAALNGHEKRMLQREYTVPGRYDINSLDITATAVPLGEDSGLPKKDFNPQRLVDRNSSRAQNQINAFTESGRALEVETSETAQGVRVFAPHAVRFSVRAEKEEGQAEGGDDGGSGAGNSAGAKQIKAHGTIGARRFEISGGMVFSSLDRKVYQPVIGYPRNAKGEFIDPETGNTTTTPKLTKIVGISEQSSRRFAPLAMLHYRLPWERSLFLSTGFTGKRDDYGVDLEYLIGPSILYKNMFFTFGGYAGKQQKLAGDLYQGAPADETPVRKDYKWGWAFSFTYRIPLGTDPGN